LDVIIANLMAATHYGLGLHLWTVNALDAEYPRNLSHAFMVSFDHDPCSSMPTC
jgi:hypothetical protein